MNTKIIARVNNVDILSTFPVKWMIDFRSR